MGVRVPPSALFSFLVQVVPAWINLSHEKHADLASPFMWVIRVSASSLPASPEQTSPPPPINPIFPNPNFELVDQFNPAYPRRIGRTCAAVPVIQTVWLSRAGCGLTSTTGIPAPVAKPTRPAAG